MLLSKATYSAFRLHNVFFFISMYVPWELNPQPFALLAQYSTTEQREHVFLYPLSFSLSLNFLSLFPHSVYVFCFFCVCVCMCEVVAVVAQQCVIVCTYPNTYRS